MSKGAPRSSDNQDIELGSELNWPPILAATGLGVTVFIAIIVLFVLSPTPAGPREEPSLPLQAIAPAWQLPHPLPPTSAATPKQRVILPPPRVVEEVVRKEILAETPELVRMPTLLVEKPVPAPPALPVQVVVKAPAPVALPAIVDPSREPSFKRRFSFSEERLRYLLKLAARELDIETEKGASVKLLEMAEKATRPKSEKTAASAEKNAAQPKAGRALILALIAQRSDLKGLPVRNEAECQASSKEAIIMNRLSRKELPTIFSDIQLASQGNRSELLERNTKLDYDLKQLDFDLKQTMSNKEWGDSVGLRMVVQKLQVEFYWVRLHLIPALAGAKGKTASEALARQAVFDLSPEVREAAVKALKDRPRSEYRSVLLEALRYPWAPVADHAAEALVSLDDQGAVFDLASLLDQPDPLAPGQNEDNTKWVTPELVRVNHLKNCLLCHAPSSSNGDLVRGFVPERDKPLPVLPVRYYQNQSGLFVRADITYIKQDFSDVQPVHDHGEWPKMQRFDFLIRKRELSADDAAQLSIDKKTATEQPTSYPQRESVLWALRQLTGQDMGDRSQDWSQYIWEQYLWED
jgi:hypothetical protein